MAPELITSKWRRRRREAEVLRGSVTCCKFSSVHHHHPLRYLFSLRIRTSYSIDLSVPPPRRLPSLRICSYDAPGLSWNSVLHCYTTARSLRLLVFFVVFLPVSHPSVETTRPTPTKEQGSCYRDKMAKNQNQNQKRDARTLTSTPDADEQESPAAAPPAQRTSRTHSEPQLENDFADMDWADVSLPGDIPLPPPRHPRVSLPAWNTLADHSMAEEDELDSSSPGTPGTPAIIAAPRPLVPTQRILPQNTDPFLDDAAHSRVSDPDDESPVQADGEDESPAQVGGGRRRRRPPTPTPTTPTRLRSVIATTARGSDSNVMKHAVVRREKLLLTVPPPPPASTSGGLSLTEFTAASTVGSNPPADNSKSTKRAFPFENWASGPPPKLPKTKEGDRRKEGQRQFQQWAHEHFDEMPIPDAHGNLPRNLPPSAAPYRGLLNMPPPPVFVQGSTMPPPPAFVQGSTMRRPSPSEFESGRLAPWPRYLPGPAPDGDDDMPLDQLQRRPPAPLQPGSYHFTSDLNHAIDAPQPEAPAATGPPPKRRKKKAVPPPPPAPPPPPPVAPPPPPVAPPLPPSESPLPPRTNEQDPGAVAPVDALMTDVGENNGNGGDDGNGTRDDDDDPSAEAPVTSGRYTRAVAERLGEFSEALNDLVQGCIKDTGGSLTREQILKYAARRSDNAIKFRGPNYWNSYQKYANDPEHRLRELQRVDEAAKEAEAALDHQTLRATWQKFQEEHENYDEVLDIWEDLNKVTGSSHTLASRQKSFSTICKQITSLTKHVHDRQDFELWAMVVGPHINQDGEVASIIYSPGLQDLAYVLGATEDDMIAAGKTAAALHEISRVNEISGRATVRPQPMFVATNTRSASARNTSDPTSVSAPVATSVTAPVAAPLPSSGSSSRPATKARTVTKVKAEVGPKATRIARDGRLKEQRDSIKDSLRAASEADIGMDMFAPTNGARNAFKFFNVPRQLAKAKVRIRGWPQGARLPPQVDQKKNIADLRGIDFELLQTALDARGSVSEGRSNVATGLRFEKVSRMQPDDMVIFTHDYSAPRPSDQAPINIVRRHWLSSLQKGRLCVDGEGKIWDAVFDLALPNPVSLKTAQKDDAPKVSRGRKAEDDEVEEEEEEEPAPKVRRAKARSLASTSSDESDGDGDEDGDHKAREPPARPLTRARSQAATVPSAQVGGGERSYPPNANKAGKGRARSITFADELESAPPRQPLPSRAPADLFNSDGDGDSGDDDEDYNPNPKPVPTRRFLDYIEVKSPKHAASNRDPMPEPTRVQTAQPPPRSDAKPDPHRPRPRATTQGVDQGHQSRPGTSTSHASGSSRRSIVDPPGHSVANRTSVAAPTPPPVAPLDNPASTSNAGPVAQHMQVPQDTAPGKSLANLLEATAGLTPEGLQQLLQLSMLLSASAGRS